jgi:hypothetical protein
MRKYYIRWTDFGQRWSGSTMHQDATWTTRVARLADDSDGGGEVAGDVRLVGADSDLLCRWFMDRAHCIVPGMQRAERWRPMERSLLFA